MSGTKITPKRIALFVLLAVVALFGKASLAANGDSCTLLGGCTTKVPGLWISPPAWIQSNIQKDESRKFLSAVGREFYGSGVLTDPDRLGQSLLEEMAKAGRLKLVENKELSTGNEWYYFGENTKNLPGGKESLGTGKPGEDLANERLGTTAESAPSSPWSDLLGLSLNDQKDSAKILEKLRPLIADYKKSLEANLLSLPTSPSLLTQQCVHPKLGEYADDDHPMYRDNLVAPRNEGNINDPRDILGKEAKKYENVINNMLRLKNSGHYSQVSNNETIAHKGQRLPNPNETNVDFFQQRVKPGQTALWTTGGKTEIPKDYWRRASEMLMNNGPYSVSSGGPMVQPGIYTIGHYECDKDGKFVEVVDVKDGKSCKFDALENQTKAKEDAKKKQVGTTCMPGGNSSFPGSGAQPNQTNPVLPNNGQNSPGNNNPGAPIPPPQTIPPPGQPNTPPGSPNLGGGGNNGGGNNGGGNNGGGQDGGLGDVVNKLMQALKGLGQGGQQNQQPQQTSNPYNDPNFACQQDTQKVCGADYKTYANSCMANRYQTSVKHLGVCTDAEKLMVSNKTTGDALQELVAQLSSSGIPTQLIQDLVSIISKSATSLFTGGSSITESVVK
ncbi:MAG: hypothetical protein Q7S57_06205 [bacterium]|nr:hypothetical protein [bacterium]